MHTHYSDGRATPVELVQQAALLGLKAIAITDHDNVRGNVEARHTAAALGVTLIPGIELTTYWPLLNRSVDVLAYWIDFENLQLKSMIARILDDLKARIEAVCQELQASRYAISYEDAEAVNGRYVGAINVITALIERGYVEDFDAGLSVFIAAWSKVAQPNLTITQAMKIVHAAGGVTVLAHPSRIQREPFIDAWQIKQLVDAGLDGIEIHHPHMDAAAQAHFSSIARQYNLAISGGSDEHGWPTGFPRLGKQPVTLEMVNALHKRIP